MADEVPIPSPPPSLRELLAFSELRPVDRSGLDEVILSCALPRWRKVAMLVSQAMDKLQSRYPQFSEDFYAERIRLLVKQGRLESQGDLRYMRFSEVRLPGES